MSVRSVLSAGDISVNKLNLHCTGRHDKHYIASWKTFGKTGAREGAGNGNGGYILCREMG